MARHIFRLTGGDTLDFLQNLVTNDVEKLSEGLVYTALLTPQGKYLADFFLVPTEEGVLLDVDASLAPALSQRLTMYKLRSDVTISDSGLHLRRGTGARPDGAFDDPRHPDLGWRAYDAEGGDDGTDWDAIRVANCIPETGIELTAESYILETCFETLHGVDFRKGCYVGQEVTARMKHKTKLRKGLRRVEIHGDPAGATEIVADGKPAGHLLTRSGTQAIAYLRFDRAQGIMQAGGATIKVLPT